MQFALQLSNVIHAIVAGRVNLKHVYVTIFRDRDAVGTLTTRLWRRFLPVSVWPDAIKGLGQNTSGRGFAHASHTGQKIGMCQAALGEGIGQRAYQGFLPNQSAEVFGRYLRASTTRKEQ